MEIIGQVETTAPTRAPLSQKASARKMRRYRKRQRHSEIAIPGQDIAKETVDMLVQAGFLDPSQKENGALVAEALLGAAVTGLLAGIVPQPKGLTQVVWRYPPGAADALRAARFMPQGARAKEVVLNGMLLAGQEALLKGLQGKF